MRAWIGFGFAVIAATLGAARAHAGACPDAHVTVTPVDEATDVPRDAEVRVFFGEREVRVYEVSDPKNRTIVKEGPADPATATIKLRAPGKPDVDPSLRRIDAAHPVLIAKPKAQLAPDTTYAVILVTANDSFVLSHFTTNHATTTDTPKLDAASGKMFTWHIAHADWKDPWGSFAEVTTRGARGDGFEVYELAPDEQPSDAKLRVIHPGTASKFRFGTIYGCIAPDFAFAERAKSPRQLSLAVRTYDAAGHTSPIVRFTLDLQHRTATSH